MEWKNELTERLQIRYPIVQAPMLGVTTPEMVACISNAGGLGSLPVGGLSPTQTRTLIHQTKALTSKPFAVNLFAHNIPAVNMQEASAMADMLFTIAAQHHLPVAKTNLSELHFYSYKQQIEILLEEQIPVVSFTFGILDDVFINAFKAKGVTLIGTATSLKEALVLDEKGIDMITAQGIEAGGHRGSFLEHEPLPLVGLISLLPGIKAHVRKPLLAAGGIYDGHTIKAALCLGAQGVQIGTAFIASDESAAIPAYKSALLEASDTDTTLTKAFSGRWARGIRNHFIHMMEGSGMSIPPYPVQNSLVAPIRAAALLEGDKEFIPMWAGQSAGKSSRGDALTIFRGLIAQTESL